VEFNSNTLLTACKILNSGDGKRIIINIVTQSIYTFTNYQLNILEPEFYILAHPVGKMRIIQEPNKVAL